MLTTAKRSVTREERVAPTWAESLAWGLSRPYGEHAGPSNDPENPNTGPQSEWRLKIDNQSA
ncbi:hypothetical protein [Lentzea albidocapillata]|nr:hypothetical protein [Lentzea albidocapillata]